MRTLVTGGLGLIGSHLTEALVAEGDEVTVVDSGVASCITPDDSPATFVCEGTLEEVVLPRYPYDLMYHCASPLGAARVDSSWVYEIVKDAEQMIEYAQQSKAKLVLFSSSEVMGMETHYAANENGSIFVDYPPDQRTAYQVGKLALEVMALTCEYPNIQIIRPVNVVGKRQRPDGGFVIPRFVEQAKRGERLTVFPPGNQTRSFLHVSDMVRFLMKLRETWPGIKGVWNVGNPENKIEIYELARRIARKFEVEVGMTNAPWQNFREAPERNLDYSKVREWGWKPEIGLEQIIDEVSCG